MEKTKFRIASIATFVFALLTVSCDSGEDEFSGVTSGLIEIANAVAPSSDGGFFVAGQARNRQLDRYDAYAAKFNREGEMIWDFRLRDEHSLVGRAIQPHPDNSLDLLASPFNPEDNRIYLASINSSGEQIASYIRTLRSMRRFGGAISADDGGFLAFGYAVFPSMGVAIAKVSESGEIEFEYIFGDSMEVSSVTNAPNGGYTIIARIEYGADHVVFHLNADGDSLWAVSDPAFHMNVGVMVCNPNGGYLIGGNDLGIESILIQTDENAGVQWSHQTRIENASTISDIAFPSNGTLVLSCVAWAFEMPPEPYKIVGMYDREIVWEVFCSNDEAGYTPHSCVLDDGNIVVAGAWKRPNDPQFNLDIYVTKVSPNGEMLWEKSYGN